MKTKEPFLYADVAICLWKNSRYEKSRIYNRANMLLQWMSAFVIQYQKL